MLLEARRSSRFYKHEDGGRDYDNPRMTEGSRMIAGALGVRKRKTHEVAKGGRRARCEVNPRKDEFANRAYNDLFVFLERLFFGDSL